MSCLIKNAKALGAQVGIEVVPNPEKMRMFAAMNVGRRTLLAACPLALLVGCGNQITVPVDVANIADAIVGALTKYAPPDVGAKLTGLYAQLKAGGDWKATLRAIADTASAVLATGVVPEPYASYARVALSGLALFLPSAGAANGVTIEQARGAAELLRGLK